MDLDLHSPPDSAGAKAAFHKPSNDPSNRKYRRRSPVSGSSSSDGEPVRERSSTPAHSWDDNAKPNDNWQRKADKITDRDHRRSRYSRDGGSYRNTDRASKRSYDDRRHEDYRRREKYAEEDQKNFPKLSPRTRGGSGSHGSYSDHGRRESEQNRSRDNVDKHSRDRSDGSGHRTRDKDREASSLEYQKYKDSSSDRGGSSRRQTNFKVEEVRSGEGDKHKRDDARDEKRDYPRTSKDGKSECLPTFEEPRGHRSGHHHKDTSWRDSKELDDPKYARVEKGKSYDQETRGFKDRHFKEPRELVEDKSVLAAKKPKLFSMDKDTDYSKDANEVQSSSSKQGQEFVGKVNAEQECVKESDIDAAKIAAMKAAELVNRNLIGTGFMSTDQKKKLLWGSKKSTATEETAHRWDTSMFSDRERQEKFNKLMSLRLHWCLWPIVGCERGREGGTETGDPRQQPCREAERAPDGLGEAVHCWPSSQRWPYCRFRALKIFICTCCVMTTIRHRYGCLLYLCARDMFVLPHAFEHCYPLKILIPIATVHADLLATVEFLIFCDGC